MVKWLIGLVIKASWMDESSLHSISFKKKNPSPFMLHHLIQTKKKHQEWCFIQLSNMGFVSGFQIWKTPQKKIVKPFHDFETETPFQTKRLGWKHWRHWIPSRSPGTRARFPRFCLHPSKIEWNQIPTEPVQQVARLAVRYSDVYTVAIDGVKTTPFQRWRIDTWELAHLVLPKKDFIFRFCKRFSRKTPLQT